MKLQVLTDGIDSTKNITLIQTRNDTTVCSTLATLSFDSLSGPMPWIFELKSGCYYFQAFIQIRLAEDSLLTISNIEYESNCFFFSRIGALRVGAKPEPRKREAKSYRAALIRGSPNFTLSGRVDLKTSAQRNISGMPLSYPINNLKSMTWELNR